MVKVLVFDTETTGLPPFQINEKDYPPLNTNGKFETWRNYSNRLKQLREESNLEKKDLERDPTLWQQYKETWPYIVQLSYIMFDTDSNTTVVNDVYVEMPEKFTNEIYLNSPSTHDITKAAITSGLQTTRVDVKDAIQEFMTFFREADVVTGHNVDFDINMLLAECIRNNENSIFSEIISVKGENKIYCTACKATNVVNICYDYNCKKTPPIFKMPKLNQAYFRMFGYSPKESALHNALIDVVACLRVFYRLWFKGIQFTENNSDVPVCGLGEPDIYIVLKDISPTNPIIEIINEFTPSGVDPAGVGSSGLTICEPIDNDEVESMMTGKSIEQIKLENEANSRLGIYKSVTGINPVQKGGTRKFKKSKNKKSKKSKNKKSKKSRKLRK
jgi:DNA polymerase III epsilon subunit-like protein